MKTKGMGIALLSAAALLGSAVAQAELPWTYAEVGYSKTDGNDFFETDALDLKGSIGFLDMWHATAQWVDGSSDGTFVGNDEDFDGYRIGVGAHPSLTPNTQLLLDLAYSDYDYDGGEGSDAISLGFGLRHSLTENFELMTEIWYSDGSFENTSGNDVDYNDTSLEFGGRYNWLPNLSTGLMMGLGGSSGSSSDDIIRVDLRWSFLGAISK